MTIPSSSRRASAGPRRTSTKRRGNMGDPNPSTQAHPPVPGDVASVTLTGGHFAWEDPLKLDSLLTEDERLIRDSARSFAQERLMPRILESNRNETFDVSVMRELGEMGFL